MICRVRWLASFISATNSTIRDALHWLPVRQRVEFKLSVLVFNCLHNLAPSYLSTMCQPVADNAGRCHLRSAARGDCCSSHKDSPLRSSQLRCGRTVHVELSSSIATQLPPSILIPSWSENWTVHQSIPLARLWQTVTAGEHNSTHHHHHHQKIYSRLWMDFRLRRHSAGSRKCALKWTKQLHLLEQKCGQNSD